MRGNTTRGCTIISAKPLSNRIMNPDISAAPPQGQDYSLTGASAALAIERGLAEADWYTTPVPKEKMRGLLQRRDG